MAIEKIFYDLATDQAFRADKSAVANDNVPLFRYKSKTTIEWQFLNSQSLDGNGDYDDFDTSMAGETVTASAAVDNDAYHYDDVNVATTIVAATPIATITLKNVSSDILRVAGRLSLTNQAGQNDIIYYNGVEASGSNYVFTLSDSDYVVGAQTPTYGYAIDDDVRIIQSTIIKDAAVDVTDAATGKYVMTMDAYNVVLQELIHGSKELDGVAMELTVKRLVGAVYVDEYVKEISARVLYKLDDDGGVAPGPPNTYPTWAEVYAYLEANYVALAADTEVALTDDSTTIITLGAVATYSAFDLCAVVDDGTNYAKFARIQVLYDGTNWVVENLPAFIGYNFAGTMSFDADVSGGNARLKITMASHGSSPKMVYQIISKVAIST